uniref:Ubiquitin-like domain-containing protein n=1 Tax=Anopheles farauti TaxID=69004 RepID=A0A182QGN3_9DIPT
MCCVLSDLCAKKRNQNGEPTRIMADIPGGSGAGSGGNSKSGGGSGGGGPAAGGDGDPGSGGGPPSSQPSSSSSAASAPSSSSFRVLRFGFGADGPITLEVTTTTGRNFSVRTNSDQTVEQLKKTISKRLTVSKDRICLLYRERELHDGTLLENGLMDGSKIILTPNVETGLLAQRAENTVMQALESLNDNQVNDFLSGKSPLNLSVRLGDHMMLIQLQLSTLNPSSQAQLAAGSTGSGRTVASGSSGGNAACKGSPAGGRTVFVKPGASSSSVVSQPNQQSPHLCSYHPYQQHVQRQQSGTGVSNGSAEAQDEVAHAAEIPTAPSKPNEVAGGNGEKAQSSSSRTYLQSVLASPPENQHPDARHYVLLRDSPEAGGGNELGGSSGQGTYFSVGQSSEGGMMMLIQGATDSSPSTGGETRDDAAATSGLPAGPGSGESATETADETRHLVLIQDPTAEEVAPSATGTGSLTPTVYLLENQPASDEKINGMYLLQRPKGLVPKRLFMPDVAQQSTDLPLTQPRSASGSKRACTSHDELLTVAAKRPAEVDAVEPRTARPAQDDSKARRITRVVSTRSRPDGASPSGVYLAGEEVAARPPTTTNAGGGGAVGQSPIKSLSNLVSARMVAEDDGSGPVEESPEEESVEAGGGGCSDPISANLTSCLCRRFESGGGVAGKVKPSDGRQKAKAHRHGAAAPSGELILPNGGVPMQQAAGRKNSSDAHQWLAGSSSSTDTTTTTNSSSSLENPALAEASRNLTQTLRKLSKRVFNSKAKHDASSHATTAHAPSASSTSSPSRASSSSAATSSSSSSASGSTTGAIGGAAATASPGRGISSGAVIESMKHHGKGIYSGTFSGTLNPALQDKFGLPKRDISTIIHILNDLLNATPQCAGRSASGATVGAAGASTSGRSNAGTKMYHEQQQQQQSQAAGVGGTNRTSWLVPAPMSSSSRSVVPATLAASQTTTKHVIQNAVASNRKHPMGMTACGCDGSAPAPCKSTNNPIYGRSLAQAGSGTGSSSSTITGGRSVILSAAPGSASSSLSSGSKIVTVIAPAATTAAPAGLPIVMCKCGAAMIKLIGGSGPAGGQCQSCQFKEAELENSKMRMKLENLRLIMQRKKERREARRQQAAPYGGDAGAARVKQSATNAGDGVLMMVDPTFESTVPVATEQQLNESPQAQTATLLHEQQHSEQKRECQEQQQTPEEKITSGEHPNEVQPVENVNQAASVAADGAVTSASATAAAATPTSAASPTTASSSPNDGATDAAGTPNGNSNAPHLVEEVDTVA